MENTEPPYITVIILNWNGFEDTRACVESLERQNDVRARIVLVDNNSRHEEQGKLKAFCAQKPKINYIQNSENKGFGKAHNSVFKTLIDEGEKWVACLNNDAVADPNWLKNMLDRAETERCSMITSKMLTFSNNAVLDNVGHVILNTSEIVPRGFGEEASNYSTPEKTLGPCAGACLYSLEMLDKVGGFDEHFFVGYEDAELALRAWLAGYDCYFEPTAQVRHKISASLNKVRSVEYLATIQANIFYSWFKLMPASVIRGHLPWFILKYMAVLLMDIVTFRFKFLKVMWKGLMDAYRQRSLIQEKRRAFQAKVQITRSSEEFSNVLTFFLWFDIQRFWKFIVLRKKSNLEV